MKINVSYWAKPIPVRKFDWCATIDGREEDSRLYGYGETKQDALDELGEAIIERVDDHIHDLMTAGAIDRETAETCFTDIDSLTYVPY